MKTQLKDNLKSIGFAVLYLFAGNIVYLLLMLLFAWMASWWWLFIIIFGIGGIASILGFSQIVGIFSIPLSANWLGRILAILITVYLLYFSINAVWTTDFLAENAKEIVVKIIATIVFASTYIPMPIAVFNNTHND